jgi:ankyrin repeat protein
MQFLIFLQNHANDVYRWQSLPQAVTYGEPVVVRIWLEAGVDPNAVGSDGYTALQRAAITGNLQLVMLLVQYGANLTALSRNQYGDLPIHLAVAYGHRNIVQWMLDNGVPVNIRNGMGATPLHSAAHNNRLEIARFLLDRGAEVNAKVINSDNRTPLHEAAAEGSVDLVQLLLDRGADINTVTSDENQTPLHWAEKVGQLRTAELLIQRGADITALDKNGRTPLELAPNYVT